MPGNILQIASSLLFGAFNKMYFVFFAFLTAFILNNNLSKIVCCSFPNFLLATKTASDFKTTSTSFKPLVNKVLPELTKSQMASAKPILGGSLTRSSIGLDDDILPIEGERDDGSLDLSRFSIAELGYSGDDLCTECKVREKHRKNGLSHEKRSREKSKVQSLYVIERIYRQKGLSKIVGEKEVNRFR